MSITMKNPVRGLALAALVVLGAAAPATASDHPYETDALRVPELKTGGSCLIRGATIHTAIGEPFVGDVLVVDGKIKAVGEVTDIPEGLVEVDASGMHLAPGVVDCHSHMAIERGINEGTVSISADVDISDSVDADDITIYRALAGGCTTARLLHGSANAIGGKHEVIKLKWGRHADELVFPGAPEGIKFALGENVKRSNWGSGNSSRFPASRMGVATLYQRAFTRAREYEAEWKAYDAAVAAGEDPMPPRRDLRLDTLVGILNREIAVHCHCYRADGILMITRVAQQFGFELGTLQHVLEGYKVAKEMADAGVGGSTFGDWWAYKMEAYDAVPQNAALMDKAGVLTSVNSDSDEMVRRMYGEAAKSVRYAGMDRVRALALVTLNAAKQLGIDARVGSIEAGKDADLVLLNGDPLSSLARVEWTMVDGEVEFQRRDTFGFDAEPLSPGAVKAMPQPLEADVQSPAPILALVGGTVHTVSGEVIEGGTVLMQAGKILQVGDDVAIPVSTRTILTNGKHVWPGMIALNTDLGLHEVGSVRATNDSREIGGNQPDVGVLRAINAESAHIGVTFYNGITRAQVAPASGGPLRGQSCVIDLDGNTWEELAFVEGDMQHLRFPTVSNTARKKEMPESLDAVRELLDDAREYGELVDLAAADESVAAPAFDPRLAALVPVVRKEQRVALHANNAQTILFALKFAKEEDLDVVLYGVTEGWKVADAIADAGVPVVVGPVLSIPSSRFDPYDARFANAAALHRAGALVAIQAADSDNTRNLPFHAAMAASFGLPEEEAVRAVTLNPARILGIDDRVGSLEPGKVADVIVTSGPLLEITSEVEYVFIGGRQVELKNRQTELYAKYQRRLRLLEAADRR